MVDGDGRPKFPAQESGITKNKHLDSTKQFFTLKTLFKMRKFFTLVALLPTLAIGQVSFVGDSIKIETPPPSGMLDFQIIIQNLDAISESTYYWSDTGTGTFYSPWCNVRVSRTAFDTSLIAHPEWHVDLKKVDVSVKVSAMTNRKVFVEVTGGDYEIKFRHVAYGSWYSFYEGSMQYHPSGTFSEGARQFFIPYRVKGQQGAIVTVHANGCSQTVGRIFYLN